MTKNNKLYETIVKDLQGKISSGIFSSGDKLNSVNELCDIYQVSPITAVKAVNELKNMGLVKAIHGKGTYVKDIKTTEHKDLHVDNIEQLVLVFTSKDNVGRNNFYGKIAAAVFEEAYELKMPIRNEYWTQSAVNGISSPAIKFNPGDGVIVLTGAPKVRLLAAISEQALTSVLIDSFVSGFHSVLTDNFRGIRQIIEHLYDLGHRRIVFASGFRRSFNALNENERLQGFEQIMEMLNLPKTVIRGDDYNDLFNLLRTKDKPTAFIFSQDDPALKFISLLKNKGIRVPEDISVAGFDNQAETEEGISQLTTVHVNKAEIGKAAIKTVLSSIPKSWKEPEWTRIPTELLIRKSTGKVKRQMSAKRKQKIK